MVQFIRSILREVSLARTVAGFLSGKISHVIGILAQEVVLTQPVKIDSNEKLDPKQKTIQTFNIDAKRFRKTKNENPPTWEIGVTS